MGNSCKGICGNVDKNILISQQDELQSSHLEKRMSNVVNINFGTILGEINPNDLVNEDDKSLLVTSSQKSIKYEENDLDKSSIHNLNYKYNPIIIENVDKPPNISSLKQTIKEEDLTWLGDYFRSHYIFKNYNEEMVNLIIKNIEKISLKENHLIKDYKFTCNNIIIVKNGNLNLKENDAYGIMNPEFSVDLKLKSSNSKSFLDRDVIGENSFIFTNLKIKKEILSVMETEFFIINQDFLKKIIHQNNTVILPLKRKFLLSIGIFSNI